MPFANVSSVRLHDQVLGNQGPWVALVSGARRGMAEVMSRIPAFRSCSTIAGIRVNRAFRWTGMDRFIRSPARRGKPRQGGADFDLRARHIGRT